MTKIIFLLSRFLLTSKLWFCRLLTEHYSPPIARRNHNQRFILTQMHRRRRQHNGTRNALCCHRRRPDNLHDFSVSAQQFASRIIHSSFDLDGRHSTASHSSGCTSTSVDPKLFLHLHQSRTLFILQERSALEILFHLVSLGTQTTKYIGNIHSHAARVQRAHPPLHAPLIGAHRYAHQSVAPYTR